jgi:hypothetical protein
MASYMEQAPPREDFHVNLIDTVQSAAEWANELHPCNAGFSALADRIDAALQANI